MRLLGTLEELAAGESKWSDYRLMKDSVQCEWGESVVNSGFLYKVLRIDLQTHRLQLRPLALMVNDNATD